MGTPGLQRAPSDRTVSEGERVGILAPTGRDARLIEGRLAQAGFPVEVCDGVGPLCDGVDAGRVGVLLLTSEGVADPAAGPRLRQTLQSQPTWSSIPILLLGAPRGRAGEGLHLLGRLGVARGATVLERPLSTSSLVAAVRLALLARHRQLEVQDLLARLEDANALLESRVEARTREVRRRAADLTLAEQEERQRIGLLLHDDLQQRLHGLGITLTLAERHLLAGDADEGKRFLQRAERTLEETAALTRNLSHELAPPVLRQDGLASLFSWLSDRARDLYRLEVDADAGGVRLPEESHRTLLYQLLRELLFNVSKHAGTDTARVTATTAEDRTGAQRVRVVVEDDGDGFDTSHPAARGLGLASVRERIHLFGGRLRVESTPGVGTRVTVELPWDGNVAPSDAADDDREG